MAQPIESYDFGASAALGEGCGGFTAVGIPIICPQCPPFPPTPAIPIVQLNPLANSTAASADFGEDFDFLSDLNPQLNLVGGLANLGQAIVHRLETPRGGLPYDLDYGTDVRAYLNGTIMAQDRARLQGEIQAELAKDERILSSSASVSINAPTSTMTIQISVVTSQGPFNFVLEVTKVSVALLSPTAQG